MQGDERERFAAVFLPHLGPAYRLARWLTGSVADAEDVVQDAALKALRGISTYSGTNARGWVLAVVRNAALTWLARNRGGPARPAGDYGPDDAPPAEARDPDDPEIVLLRKLEGEEVRRAIAELPGVFREVIVLREIEEFSYREIAALLDIPIGTVMSRLARARGMLVRSLGVAP